jgi:hypothetical protein
MIFTNEPATKRPASFGTSMATGQGIIPGLVIIMNADINNLLLLRAQYTAALLQRQKELDF